MKDVRAFASDQSGCVMIVRRCGVARLTNHIDGSTVTPSTRWRSMRNVRLLPHSTSASVCVGQNGFYQFWCDHTLWQVQNSHSNGLVMQWAYGVWAYAQGGWFNCQKLRQPLLGRTRHTRISLHIKCERPRGSVHSNMHGCTVAHSTAIPEVAYLIHLALSIICWSSLPADNYGIYVLGKIHVTAAADKTDGPTENSGWTVNEMSLYTTSSIIQIFIPGQQYDHQRTIEKQRSSSQVMAEGIPSMYEPDRCGVFNGATPVHLSPCSSYHKYIYPKLLCYTENTSQNWISIEHRGVNRPPFRMVWQSTILCTAHSVPGFLDILKYACPCRYDEQTNDFLQFCVWHIRRAK